MARLTGTYPWPLPIVLFSAILSAATYGVHTSPARFRAVAAESTPALAAPEDLRLWRRSAKGLSFSGAGAKTEVRLAARQGRGVAVVQTAVAVPEGTQGLRVELEIGTEGFVPGAKPWQNARLQIMSFDRGGTYLRYWPRDLVVVSADRRFGPVTAVLPIREDLGRILVRIYNGADTGVLRIASPKIVPVMERPVFAFLRGALIWAWAAAGLWAAWAAARRASTPLRAGMLFGLLVLALAGTLAPQPAFRAATAPIEALMRSYADAFFWQRPSSQPRQAASKAETAGAEAEAKRSARATGEKMSGQRTSPPAAPAQAATRAPPDYPFSFKEAGHFFLFLLLGIVCYAAFPRTSWHGRVLCLASFAVTTESLQLFVMTRSSRAGDLAADMAGLVLAALIVASSARITAAVKARDRDRSLPGG